MAINIDTQDIDNYPGTIKRVTVDQDTITPIGFEGDEQFVLTVSTTAYSDNDARTAIQDSYITDFAIGWCKSSGLVGSGGKFVLDSSNYKLKVMMDATISGSDGNGYYDISLTYDGGGIAITGEAIAQDIEEKIRSITCVTGDTGYQLAYTNSSVEYTEGKFKISSGTIGRYYTGQYRSSVQIAAGSTNDCTTVLGFNTPTVSEDIAGTSVPEALITSDYTADTDTLNIGAGTGVSIGDCMEITDNVNTDYFPVISGSTTTVLKVPTLATNGFTGISNSYTVASGTKVQILRAQDPDVEPNNWCENYDSVVRYGVKGIINLIDYSS